MQKKKPFEVKIVIKNSTEVNQLHFSKPQIWTTQLYSSWCTPLLQKHFGKVGRRDFGKIEALFYT